MIKKHLEAFKCLCLDSIFSDGIKTLLALLFLGSQGFFMRCESFAHSTGLLLSEILGHPALVTVELFRFSFCVWLMTVRTRAIDFLTKRIFESLEAAPPVTLATRKFDNSCFNSFSCLSRSSFFLPLSSLAFTFPMLSVFLGLSKSPM